MEAKKKKSGLVGVVVLLVVALLGSVGYIAYDKVFNNNSKSIDDLETKISQQNKTINNLSSLLNNGEKEVEIVDKPNYNVVTKQIAKSLIGKYVSGDPNAYFEIKENGELTIVINICEGYATYTSKELDWMAYYDNRIDGFQRTTISFFLKPGYKNTLHSNYGMALTFETTDNIENANITFSGDDIGCGSSKYIKQ